MQFLINFAYTTTVDAINAYLSKNKCTVVRSYVNFDLVYLVSCKVRPKDDPIVISIIEDDDNSIKLLGEVVPVNNYHMSFDPGKPFVSISTSDEKDWWKNYILAHADFVNPSVDITLKGANATVYVVDSGIDATHPEFVDTSITNLCSFTGDYVDNSGHGTAIASVISGKTCGLSVSKLKICKIFDPSNTTRQSDLISAFDAILNDFLVDPTQLGIVNCSWSIPKNSFLEELIQLMIDAGLYVVAAAGNSGMPIANVTPASMPDVLTIGSFGPDLKPSNFSNYTNPSVISNTEDQTNSGALDGWAPGEQIWVAVPGGSYGYSYGTSIAAGIHSSIIAYDLSDFVNPDGSLPGNMIRVPITRIARMSLAHEGLLDLSDPKYTNSVNAISTLCNKALFSRYRFNPYFDIGIRVGTSVSSLLFNPQVVKSAELLSPLPQGAYIQNSGTLILEPTTVVGGHETTTTVLRLTFMDDTVVDKELTITVVAADFDNTGRAVEDQVVVVTPLAMTCLMIVVGGHACHPLGCELYGNGYWCDAADYSVYPKSVSLNCSCTYGGS